MSVVSVSDGIPNSHRLDGSDDRGVLPHSVATPTICVAQVVNFV